jgi:hypothetical protein
MSKGRQSFRRSDLTRAIKAVMATGAAVDRAEIDPSTGKIVLVIVKPDASRGQKTNGMLPNDPDQV